MAESTSRDRMQKGKSTFLQWGDPLLKAGPAAKIAALLDSRVPQFNSYSCSAAAVATVINAIRRISGRAGETHPLTQPEILARVDLHHWRERVSEKGYQGHHGMPLFEFGEVVRGAFEACRISTRRVDTVAIQPSMADAPAQRQGVRDALLAAAGSWSDFLIAHFTQGEYFGDWYGGHISPVGTYDAARQRVLVLDVDPECPAPYWVSFDRFFKGLAGRFKVIGTPGGGYVRIQLKRLRSLGV